MMYFQGGHRNAQTLFITSIINESFHQRLQFGLLYPVDVALDIAHEMELAVCLSTCSIHSYQTHDFYDTPTAIEANVDAPIADTALKVIFVSIVIYMRLYCLRFRGFSVLPGNIRLPGGHVTAEANSEENVATLDNLIVITLK